jgi:hypothetical protein
LRSAWLPGIGSSGWTGADFNGQSTVVLDGERATGESYTIAHHLFTADGERKIMIASLRYLDTFVKTCACRESRPRL